MRDIRQAAALVAHVLHTPMTELEDAEIGLLLEWADDAADLVKQLAPKKGR